MAQTDNLKFDGLKFKVKAVMIDLDGTLIHTAPEIAAAANLMLLDLSLPVLPLKIVESYIGAGAQMLVKRCLTQQLGAEPVAEIFAQAETLFFARYAENAADRKSVV